MVQAFSIVARSNFCAACHVRLRALPLAAGHPCSVLCAHNRPQLLAGISHVSSRTHAHLIRCLIPNELHNVHACAPRYYIYQALPQVQGMLLSLYNAAKPVFEGRVSAIIDTVWSLWTVATNFLSPLCSKLTFLADGLSWISNLLQWAGRRALVGFLGPYLGHHKHSLDGRDEILGSKSSDAQTGIFTLQMRVRSSGATTVHRPKDSVFQWCDKQNERKGPG